ncbi:MAG: hypothetical protein ACJAVK_001030 [Akkermansiaceae bacterium]|jgi:hypothetical protein
MTSLNLWQEAFFVLGEILVILFLLPMFAAPNGRGHMHDPLLAGAGALSLSQL